MSAQDNVAVIALVVSLIALVIALGQLAQQLLGTAEGYRRCAEPVIGEWHRLRWRKFVWSELRYETHFITPRFTMQAIEDSGDGSKGLICFKDVKTNVKPKMNVSTWFTGKRLYALSEAPAVLGLSVLSETEKLEYSVETQASIYAGHNFNARRQAFDNEKGNADIPHVGISYVKPISSGTLFRSEDQASWLILLRRMHPIYKAYQVGKQPNSTYQAREPGRVPPQNPRVTVDNTAPVEAGIQFVESIWDTLPDDVNKPLASTTLGTLITFSIRLGMQWRTLKGVRSDLLLCEGEGYAITFTDLPSVGLVAKFTEKTRNHGPLLQMTPNRATEKLLFGIIPGAKHLVDQDIWCIPDDRKTNKVMVEICNHISRNDKLFKLRDKQRNWETKNEVITFLCEFLPLTGSRCLTHYFWGWDPSRQSVLKFWEGRLAIWRHLKELEDAGKLRDDTLKAVCKHLTYLRETYPHDMFGFMDKEMAVAEDPTGERLQVQANLVKDCRSIFDWTTDWFVTNGFSACDPADKGSHPRTLYMHLVAAHLWMGSHCFDEAKKRTRKDRKLYNSGAEKRKLYRLKDDKYGVPVHFNYFDQHLYHVAQTYIQHLTNEEYGVPKYMQEQELGLEDELVEVAWWVMVLRGIVWTLPTNERTAGEPIPSSFYENDTPVYIT